MEKNEKGLHYGSPDAGGARELMMDDMPLGMTAGPQLQDSLYKAAKSCVDDFEKKSKLKTGHNLPSVRPIKLTPRMQRNIILGILGTNKEESARFIECQYALNILLRACGTLYDEMVTLYDPLTDPSFKQAIKNAEKTVTRLLTACMDALHLDEDRARFINDRGRTADDECQWTFQQCADWIAERTRTIVTYGMVMNSDEWRLREIDQVLARVFCMEYVDRCQEAMYESIRNLANGTTPNKQ
jgi:hypothetical protein